jgi:hypothetical protein
VGFRKKSGIFVLEIALHEAREPGAAQPAGLAARRSVSDPARFDSGHDCHNSNGGELTPDDGECQKILSGKISFAFHRADR